MENECVRITLYESPLDYEKDENREIQMSFRKETGIDLLAHGLEKEVTILKDEDLSIEIFSGSFPHGGIKLIKYYFGNSKNLTLKSLASEVRIVELDMNGNELWSEVCRINK